MTRARSFLWAAIGGVGALFFERTRGARLCAPVEVGGILRTTPLGWFGAPRNGPPAHLHQGVDLVAAPGSHVLAVGDGEIVSALPGLGKVVRKLRLDGLASWIVGGVPVASIIYADLGVPLVEPGDRVRAGDPIATVSASGFVHFAVRTVDGRFIDPRLAGFVYRTGAE